jgi:hypothetical protein
LLTRRLGVGFGFGFGTSSFFAFYSRRCWCWGVGLSAIFFYVLPFEKKRELRYSAAILFDIL